MQGKEWLTVIYIYMCVSAFVYTYEEKWVPALPLRGEWALGGAPHKETVCQSEIFWLKSFLPQNQVTSS